MNAAAEILIQGRVQGVGYRHFCFTRANELHLNGWVRNLPDGNVSAYVEGDRTAIENLLEQLKNGPYNASVTALEVRWVTYSGTYYSFHIAR